MWARNRARLHGFYGIVKQSGRQSTLINKGKGNIRIYRRATRGRRKTIAPEAAAARNSAAKAAKMRPTPEDLTGGFGVVLLVKTRKRAARWQTDARTALRKCTKPYGVEALKCCRTRTAQVDIVVPDVEPNGRPEHCGPSWQTPD